MTGSQEGGDQEPVAGTSPSEQGEVGARPGAKAICCKSHGIKSDS